MSISIGNITQEEIRFARLINLYYIQFSQQPLSEKILVSAARDKAKRYGGDSIYYLRTWLSLASSGGFSLDREAR